MDKYKLEDLIDLKELEKTFKMFSELTGFTTGIIDNDNNILISTGWRKICLNFHRKHEVSIEQCDVSNSQLAILSKKVNKLKINRCNNGLIDGTVPIIIAGVYYGSLFTGQVFFEEPDKDFFEKQARKYNYDNDKYMDSLLEVPVVTARKFTEALEFLLSVISMLIQKGIEKE